MTAMPFIKQLLRRREAGIAVMLVLVFVAVGAVEPRFLSGETLWIVLLAIPLMMIAAMGQMTVILARHVDLSIGSILGFSAFTAGLVLREFPHLPLWVSFAVAVLSGATLGCVNGALVTFFRLPAIIVTLGTLSLYRGALFTLSGGEQIDPNDIPESLIRMAQTSPLGLPWIVIIAAAVAMAMHGLLKHSQLGRQIYALGSNPAAASLRGLRVPRLTLFVFTLSGALAGLAGILYAARFGYVNPGITGVGFEFTVIAAVVIGGVSIQGGVGSTLGTVLGVLLLGAVTVALPVLGVSGLWQNAIYGSIIVLALVIDRTVRAGGIRGVLARPSL